MNTVRAMLFLCGGVAGWVGLPSVSAAPADPWVAAEQAGVWRWPAKPGRLVHLGWRTWEALPGAHDTRASVAVRFGGGWGARVFRGRLWFVEGGHLDVREAALLLRPAEIFFSPGVMVETWAGERRLRVGGEAAAAVHPSLVAAFSLHGFPGHDARAAVVSAHVAAAEPGWRVVAGWRSGTAHPHRFSVGVQAAPDLRLQLQHQDRWTRVEVGFGMGVVEWRLTRGTHPVLGALAELGLVWRAPRP